MEAYLCRMARYSNVNQNVGAATAKFVILKEGNNS